MALLANCRAVASVFGVSAVGFSVAKLTCSWANRACAAAKCGSMSMAWPKWCGAKNTLMSCWVSYVREEQQNFAQQLINAVNHHGDEALV